MAILAKNPTVSESLLLLPLFFLFVVAVGISSISSVESPQASKRSLFICLVSPPPSKARSYCVISCSPSERSQWVFSGFCVFFLWRCVSWIVALKLVVALLECLLLLLVGGSSQSLQEEEEAALWDDLQCATLFTRLTAEEMVATRRKALRVRPPGVLWIGFAIIILLLYSCTPVSLAAAPLHSSPTRTTSFVQGPAPGASSDHHHELMKNPAGAAANVLSRSSKLSRIQKKLLQRLNKPPVKTIQVQQQQKPLKLLTIHSSCNSLPHLCLFVCLFVSLLQFQSSIKNFPLHLIFILL